MSSHWLASVDYRTRNCARAKICDAAGGRDLARPAFAADLAHRLDIKCITLHIRFRQMAAACICRQRSPKPYSTFGYERATLTDWTESEAFERKQDAGRKTIIDHERIHLAQAASAHRERA